MPREAKLFDLTKGSPVKALSRVVNVPPNWIERARASRKSREADIVQSMKQIHAIVTRRGPLARPWLAAAQATKAKHRIGRT